MKSESNALDAVNGKATPIITTKYTKRKEKEGMQFNPGPWTLNAGMKGDKPDLIR